MEYFYIQVIELALILKKRCAY